MSNYPLGAKYDPRAPYNEELVTKEILISATISRTIEIVVDKRLDPSVYDDVAKESPEMDAFRDFCKNGWDVDELVIMEDF
jgi:hypothetical protein